MTADRLAQALEAWVSSQPKGAQINIRDAATRGESLTVAAFEAGWNAAQAPAEGDGLAAALVKIADRLPNVADCEPLEVELRKLARGLRDKPQPKGTTYSTTDGARCDNCRHVLSAHGDGGRTCPAPSPAPGAATFDLTEARSIVVDAIRRMRASHVDCHDLTMKAEDFMRATHAAAKPDELWTQTLEERDRYHEVADSLAQAIASHLGVEIGEHSSANCPWDRALEALDEAAEHAAVLAECDRLRDNLKSVWAKAEAAAELQGFKLVMQMPQERVELIALQAPAVAQPNSALAAEVLRVCASISQHIQQGVASEALESAQRPGYGTGIYTYLKHRVEDLRAAASGEAGIPIQTTGGANG